MYMCMCVGEGQWQRNMSYSREEVGEILLLGGLQSNRTGGQLPCKERQGKQSLTPPNHCFVSVPPCQLGKWWPFSPASSPSPERKGWKLPCTCLRVAASSPSLQEGAGLLVSANEGAAPFTVFAELTAAGDRRNRLSCTCLAGERSW